MRLPSWRGARWVVALVGIAACAGGGAGGSEVPEPTSEWTRVMIWVGGDVYDMHGIRVTADSLSGVAFHDPLDCAACRMRFARADIDSIRVRETSGSRDDGTPWSTTIASLTAAVLFAILIVLVAQ